MQTTLNYYSFEGLFMSQTDIDESLLAGIKGNINSLEIIAFSTEEGYTGNKVFVKGSDFNCTGLELNQVTLF